MSRLKPSPEVNTIDQQSAVWASMVGPHKYDFSPHGDRTPSAVDHYFHQDELLNSCLLEFARPKLAYPHLMTPANFRRLLSYMTQFLADKASQAPAGHRVQRAAQTVSELHENMQLLNQYCSSLYKA